MDDSIVGIVDGNSISAVEEEGVDDGSAVDSCINA
jgi:hypothetical protein